MLRLFVSLALPVEAKSAVMDLQRSLRSRLGERGIRWLYSTQLHLTLRFLGDVPTSVVGQLTSALAQAAAGTAVFELALTGLGCFPSARQPRVLWLGFDGQLDSLHSLQAGVQAATGAWGKVEDRQFHPHLTLARIQPHARVNARVWRELEQRHAARRLVSWRVDAVHLMRSELRPAGAVYTAVAALPLGANAFAAGAPEKPRSEN